MAISHAWYVRCDVCGIPAEISTEDPKQARALAKSQGFSRPMIGGRFEDRCPDHAIEASS